MLGCADTVREWRGYVQSIGESASHIANSIESLTYVSKREQHLLSFHTDTIICATNKIMYIWVVFIHDSILAKRHN